MVKPIPDGYTAVTPYIVVDGAAEAIEFYKKAFGAEEVMRLPNPETGSLMHAEMTINGSHIMICDVNPGMGLTDPKALGGVACWISLYLPDMDATFAQAVAAGAIVKMPPVDMFWGDRMAGVEDPFGQQWNLMTHTVDLSEEEIQAGFKKMMESGACAPGAGD